MRKSKVPGEFSLRMMIDVPVVRECTGIRIRTPKDVRDVCSELVMSGQELFMPIAVNAKNFMIETPSIVTLGLLDSTQVHPREVFRKAVILSAASIILVHNHPSGDPTPSAEDIRITRQMIEAGKILDIKVLDHIVVVKTSDTCQNGFASLRESGLVEFA